MEKRPAKRMRSSGVQVVAAVLIVVLVGLTLSWRGAAATPPTWTGGRVPTVEESSTDITLTVPASQQAPGYQVNIRRSPFAITTTRQGKTILRTAESMPITVETSVGPAEVTMVRSATWQDGKLTLRMETNYPDLDVTIQLIPEPDRYRLRVAAEGDAATVKSVALRYDMAASGHWYGHGEARTPDGGPYHDQPWPLDSGKVFDPSFSPASYYMIEPFWFTQSGSGFYVQSTEEMTVSLGVTQPGVAEFVNPGTTFDSTVFIGPTPRDVYEDYIGIAGKPNKSDAPAEQYRSVAWNSWAQFYTNVNQEDFLKWVRQIHHAGIPAHSFTLDDGWMSHYGDFTFNDKFPDPKAMVDEVHRLGYKFGVWITLWINHDAENYQVAKSKGYLLKSKTDPSQPCTVTWWNGTAGIVDLANPEARAWFEEQLRTFMSKYGVDGFKFDTRFFDERCAPYRPGMTMQDYQRLGAEFAEQFDLLGMGIRTHWTGSQQYGFVTRQIDKGTSWRDLQAAVSQNLALSTVGYPFVETDMIGGSLGEPPPTKEVLVRWAQAAAAMPLMYASTSPVSVPDWTKGGAEKQYDEQTIDLYRKAVELHEALTPYILKQVDRAVSSGEPIMKPLFFNYPQDAATYSLDDEWLLGDSLLVAPVLSDATSRDIHVPPGCWLDVRNRKVIRGPVTVHNYSAPLDTLPLFVRLGSPDTGTLVSALSRVLSPAPSNAMKRDIHVPPGCGGDVRSSQIIRGPVAFHSR